LHRYRRSACAEPALATSESNWNNSWAKNGLACQHAPEATRFAPRHRRERERLRRARKKNRSITPRPQGGLLSFFWKKERKKQRKKTTRSGRGTQSSPTPPGVLNFKSLVEACKNERPLKEKSLRACLFYKSRLQCKLLVGFSANKNRG